MLDTTLSHFRVTGKLGEGGMGEVYRAEDSRLGREVAIKVLPAAFVADPDRLARFEREARVLASLAHPGIAQIFEVGAEGDRHFLVMELAPGETLAARIARGPLPLAEALPVALQIAEALEYAHERGIVHRDLKPANVMVDEGGRVKVLDFGLARALEQEARSGAADLAHSPTLTSHGTIAGLLLGTAAYMSPEQAAGKVADRRADVWAFALVLLEMLTGKQTFQGETASHVLAGVLKDEPDWSGISSAVPPDLRRLLERCLRKDPRRRMQSMGDARLALEELVAGGPDAWQAPAAQAPPAPAARRPWLAWAVAGVALAAVALLLGRELLDARARDAEAPLRFELALPLGTTLDVAHQHDLLAMSRDGRQQAFLVRDERGSRMIAIRELDQLGSRILSGTEGAACPAFSPDGRWIAFFTGPQLLKVPVGGGSPEVIAAAAGDCRGLTWSSDGYLYAAPDTQMGLARVRESGGALEAVTTLDEGRRERTHRWPHAVSGAPVVLFTVDTTTSTEFYDDARIEALRTDTGERRVLVEQASRARYLAGGVLVFSRGGSLYGADVDLQTLELRGTPTVLVQGVATTVASGAAHFAVSDSGSLFHVPGPKTARAAVVPRWIRRDGQQEPSPIAAGDYDQISLAPDGRRVAMIVNERGSQDLWVADLARGGMSRLTFARGANEPAWSPDGIWIAYREAAGIFRRRADGSGEPELLRGGAALGAPTSFTPDGKGLVVEIAHEAGSDLALLDLTATESPPRMLVEGPAFDAMGVVSPDGRWLAYVSAESGRPEVYVRSLGTAGGKWQLSVQVGFEPRWGPDMREIFFRDGVGDLYAVAIEPGEAFSGGPPQRLVGGMRTGDNARTYSVDHDGQRFLTLGLAGEQDVDRLDLVLHWDREVARLLAPR